MTDSNLFWLLPTFHDFFRKSYVQFLGGPARPWKGKGTLLLCQTRRSLQEIVRTEKATTYDVMMWQIRGKKLNMSCCMSVLQLRSFIIFTSWPHFTFRSKPAKPGQRKNAKVVCLEWRGGQRVANKVRLDPFSNYADGIAIRKRRC